MAGIDGQSSGIARNYENLQLRLWAILQLVSRLKRSGLTHMTLWRMISKHFLLLQGVISSKVVNAETFASIILV